MEKNPKNDSITLKDIDALKQQINAQVNSMKEVVKRSKLYIIRRLVRNIETQRKKKGKEKQREKFLRRADNLKKEIDIIKALSDADVAVTALYHQDNCEKICFKNDTPLADRAKMRVASFKFVQQAVKEFYGGQAQTHLPTMTSILIKLIERRKKKTAKELEKIKAELEEAETKAVKKEAKVKSLDASDETIIHFLPSEEKSNLKKEKNQSQEFSQRTESEDSSEDEEDISASGALGELKKGNKITSLLLGDNDAEEEEEEEENSEVESGSQEEEEEDLEDSEDGEKNIKEPEKKNHTSGSSPLSSSTKVLPSSKLAKAIQLNLNELSMDEEIVIEKQNVEKEEEITPMNDQIDPDANFFLDASDPTVPDANAVLQNSKEALKKNKSNRTFLSEDDFKPEARKSEGIFRKGKWIPFSPNKRIIQRKPFRNGLERRNKNPKNHDHHHAAYQNKGKKRPMIENKHSSSFKKRKI